MRHAKFHMNLLSNYVSSQKRKSTTRLINELNLKELSPVLFSCCFSSKFDKNYISETLKFLSVSLEHYFILSVRTRSRSSVILAFCVGSSNASHNQQTWRNNNCSGMVAIKARDLSPRAS